MGQFSDTGVPLDDTARNLLFPGGSGQVTDVGQFSDTGVPLDDTARNLLFGNTEITPYNSSNFLPEGGLDLTPKKKFNVPKIEKQITENIVDDNGDETTIQWKEQYPEGVTSTTVSESKSVENGVIIERKTIRTETSGLLNEQRDGKYYIFGVEVSLEDYSKLFEVQDTNERIRLAKEIISRY